ncbi:alpha/beta fold hydrolase [Pseudonocardia sp. CA-107938]|uniref:alpha/beta fold hydrolase n=1 Tax=Pseudonocardia sp. CA-107938 TaxID=3240021 RepID=UPI003D8FFCF4
MVRDFSGASAVVCGGRRVAVAEYGDPEGRPVFLLHGTPASRLGNDFADAPARERGIRVLCPDRGGIGRSDPVPGRTVAGYAGELVELADALGIDEFAVIGYSGGGPFAVACAAGCGPRLTSVGLMAAVAPVDDRPGARDGLAASDRHLLDAAVRSPFRAGLVLRFERVVTLLVPALAVRELSAELTPVDRAELARHTPREAMAGFVEALRPGPDGVLTDYRLWGSPWRVDWSAVTVPVHVFQGDADPFVPVHHAEDLVRRLPAGVGHLHLLPGVGHLSLQTRFGEILDALGRG